MSSFLVCLPILIHRLVKLQPQGQADVSQSRFSKERRSNSDVNGWSLSEKIHCLKLRLPSSTHPIKPEHTRHGRIRGTELTGEVQAQAFHYPPLRCTMLRSALIRCSAEVHFCNAFSILKEGVPHCFLRHISTKGRGLQTWGDVWKAGTSGSDPDSPTGAPPGLWLDVFIMIKWGSARANPFWQKSSVISSTLQSLWGDTLSRVLQVFTTFPRPSKFNCVEAGQWGGRGHDSS